MSGGWTDSTRRERLPANWIQLCRQVHARSRNRCEVPRFSRGGATCGRLADGGVDHIDPQGGDDLSNLRDTCFLPQTPVLMADRTTRAIQDIRVGDSVIGHDGRSHRVLDVGRLRYDGPMIQIDHGVTATPEHRFLTRSGWRELASLGPRDEVWVPHPQMLSLRSTEHKVLWDVVVPLPVKVMHALHRGQRPAEHLLHDVAVLHDEPAAHEDPGVPLGRDLALELGDGPGGARLAVQPRQATLLGAGVRPGSRGDHSEGRAAHGAGDLAMLGSVLASSLRGALARAGRVVLGQAARHQEALAAFGAGPFSQRGAFPNAGWYALEELRVVSYSGYVHDITVAGSHSYVVAGGWAAHNCRWHHQKKTTVEGQVAKAEKKAARKRPAETHPGLIQR